MFDLGNLFKMQWLPEASRTTACPTLQHSPLLAAWAGLLSRLASAGCQILELDCQLQRPEEQCAVASWALSLGIALLAVAFVLGSAVVRLLRWLTRREGSRMIVVAGEVLAELRKAQPLEYPAQWHQFAAAPASALAADPLDLLLCSVCHRGISSGACGTSAGSSSSLMCLSCVCCGLLTHDSCARRAGKTCRPLWSSSERQPHFWQAHGTVADPEALEGGGRTAGLTCLYCLEPADSDVLAVVEPLWRCSLCSAVCHVQCFCDAHPQLTTVAGKLRALLDVGSGGRRQERHKKQQQQQQQTQQLTNGGRSENGVDGGDGQDSASGGGGATIGEAQQQEQQRQHSDGGDSGYSSDSESDALYDTVLQRQRSLQRRRRRLHSQDVRRLDECSLGPSRRSMLPPIAVRPAMRSGGSSSARLDQMASEQQQQKQKDLKPAQQVQEGPHQQEHLPQHYGGTASSPNSPSDASASAAHQPQPLSARQRRSSQHQRQTAAANGRKDGSGGGGGKERGGGRKDGSSGGSGSKKKRSSWWRKLYRPAQLQWQDYRIDQLPPGCKPVLVFINTKSGPQVGATLRHRFLRILHPLQVVELPRQKPDAALQLFAPVAAQTRILVVGGDGSVAWILSCLEEVKAAQAAAGRPHWTPPPVAVLPLGTGNDLARCLGWGGGHGAWQQEDVGTMLAEVQHSARSSIDRWNVSLSPPVPPEPALLRSPRGKLQAALDGSKLQSMANRGLSSLLHRGGGGGGSGGASSAAPRAVVKQMNNYLGIGVDAKVALEFHQMREQMPFFFTSQLGNKLWYTAVGGKDIVSGHACSNLARKLEVVCDGRLVELPPDIEGLLVLNINSYMGGVDLWRNSYSLGQPSWRSGGGSDGGGGGHGQGQGEGEGETAQSMMDARVELVAVYGSWHLGQLQVGLSRAVRLGQGRQVAITSLCPLPMQVDGEPWVQAPAVVSVSRRGQGLMLRRVQSKPLARMMAVVSEVLEESERRGTITAAQHQSLMGDVSARLQPLLLHPG